MSYRQQLRHITCRWFAPCLFMLACILEPVPACSAERPPITLRAGPGEQHAIVATLPPALITEFTVLDERGAWSKVRVVGGSEGASGPEGWLQLGALLANTPALATGLERSLAPAPPAVAPVTPPASRSPKSGPGRPAATPTGERPPIALRAGPGDEHAIVATLPPALITEFTVLDERGAWSKVRVAGGSEGASGPEGWLQLGALLAGSPAPAVGLERAPAPTPPAVAPATPPAGRSPAPAPEPVAPPLARATPERSPEPVPPSPKALPVLPMAERPPEPAPPSPKALPVLPMAERPPEPAPPSPAATGAQTTTGQPAEPRTALVIGNAAYEREIGDLKNSRNDAEDVAITLHRLGFQVTHLRDVVHEEMEEALHAFIEQLRQHKGVGLFYYAGHGAELEGKGYLLPLRSGIRQRWQLPYKAMHVNYVQSAMEEAGNRMNMIVLDACRDIPTFEASDKKTRSRGQRGLPAITAGPDMLIAYATGPGQVALDGDEKGRNGIYTKHLLRAMTRPGLSAEDVVRDTVRGVLEETQGQQRPYSSVSLAERFEFVPSPSTAEQGPARTERSEGRAAPGAGQMARAENPREPQESQATPSPATRALRLEQARDKAGREFLRNSIGMEFVCLPAGEFPMGSNNGRADEQPPHLVRVDAFCLGKYEVTQEQWRAVMGDHPSPVADPRLPVHGVTREEAEAFVNQLNGREKTSRYRLPREQEWEYAARAGSSGSYGFRAEDPLVEYAWYRKNARGRPHPGGQLKPNAWGLHDMHGNIAEWVQDQYGPYTQPVTRSAGRLHVHRGGSWSDTAEECRSTARKSAMHGKKDKTIGVRVVLDNP